MAGNEHERGSRALARLEVTRGPGTGEMLEVDAPVVRIGRAPANEIVLDDDSVSANHARMLYSDGGWKVIDLNSTNGTYVEGVRLAPEVLTPLSEGATMAFGGVKLVFRPDESADPGSVPDAPGPAAEQQLPDNASGFRLPVWVLALIILAIAIVIFLVLWGTAPVALAEAPHPDLLPDVPVLLP
jgi:pSer/pThr/pTyr-binding forkhead associated (FHA) protein